ncbi:hypothetical protein [Lignipirellula cremea]|uniref:hypothetical protein n=1 Tax=Lignipirellula cremea TaxID=2528010 RepID=UPI0011A93DE8|nr:hypothetical protein [Lignipirellula cremea]
MRQPMANEGTNPGFGSPIRLGMLSQPVQQVNGRAFRAPNNAMRVNFDLLLAFRIFNVPRRGDLKNASGDRPCRKQGRQQYQADTKMAAVCFPQWYSHTGPGTVREIEAESRRKLRRDA